MKTGEGFFFTIEGTEGAGKTTVLNLVQQYFEKNNIKVTSTREPGGVRIAEQIRTIALNTKNKEMDPKTEALLFAAARSQHYEEVINPALARGDLVLCDRFIDSSLVYQGTVRGLGVGIIEDISRFAIGYGRMPDLTVLLDVRPEVGLERISSAGEAREINRLDVEQIEFHRKIYEGYKQLAMKNPARIKIIDGEQSLEKVASQVIQKIQEAIDCSQKGTL